MGGMGPTQHSLTTATPFISQRIIFKARALGSNLIDRRLSTSQLPILSNIRSTLPRNMIYFISLLSSHPLWASPPPLPSFARFCDTRISGCRLIWTINSCRGECFKSLRKNKIPHNVNSCDKCSCTAGGNGYRNHMFKGTGTGTV